MKKDTQNKPTETSEPYYPQSSLRENIEAIIIAVILAMFIRTFIIQAFKIPSGSMKETLQIGDHILVNKFIYGVKIPFFNISLIPVTDPEREDVIVFKYPEDPSKDFIKRVVGISGDVIEVKNKELYVNNEIQANKPYVIHSDSRIFPSKLANRDNFGPFTVPENSLFVMGDNRDNSHDSRFWGVVNLKAVKGKAFIIYWSWDSRNFGVRWGRLGHLIR
ncbi:MAG: signal peptidase I [Proteobacteria bacterium]|nr:signal peptidase I [Pseudomonadota bacterium]